MNYSPNELLICLASRLIEDNKDCGYIYQE